MNSKITYVWATRDQPHAGIRRGDHLLIREVVDEDKVIHRYWTDEDGRIWSLYPSHFTESRMEHFLEGNGPLILGLSVSAITIVYLAWHVVRWAA